MSLGMYLLFAVGSALFNVLVLLGLMRTRLLGREIWESNSYFGDLTLVVLAPLCAITVGYHYYGDDGLLACALGSYGWLLLCAFKRR